jgi:hypothetical protein
MKIRFLVFALVFSVLLTLCACDTQENSDLSDVSNISDISDVSDVSVPEKLPDGAVRITTDKESYGFDEKVIFKIEVDSDEEFSYGYDYFIEYLDGDGSWKRCEKDYYFIEIAMIGKREAKVEFPLSERADEGKEKYRIAMRIHVGNNSYDVRSNEFTAK